MVSENNCIFWDTLETRETTYKKKKKKKFLEVAKDFWQLLLGAKIPDQCLHAQMCIFLVLVQ